MTTHSRPIPPEVALALGRRMVTMVDDNMVSRSHTTRCGKCQERPCVEMFEPTGPRADWHVIMYCPRCQHPHISGWARSLAAARAAAVRAWAGVYRQVATERGADMPDRDRELPYMVAASNIIGGDHELTPMAQAAVSPYYLIPCPTCQNLPHWFCTANAVRSDTVEVRLSCDHHLPLRSRPPNFTSHPITQLSNNCPPPSETANTSVGFLWVIDEKPPISILLSLALDADYPTGLTTAIRLWNTKVREELAAAADPAVGRVGGATPTKYPDVGWIREQLDSAGLSGKFPPTGNR